MLHQPFNDVLTVQPAKSRRESRGMRCDTQRLPELASDGQRQSAGALHGMCFPSTAYTG